MRIKITSSSNTLSSFATPRLLSLLVFATITILGLIVLAGNAFAQSAQPSTAVSEPTIEDQQLYYSFFNYHQGLVNSMQTAAAANSQSSV